MTKQRLKHKVIILAFICTLGACSKDKSAEPLKDVLDTVEKEQQQVEEVEPEFFTHRHLEDYIHNVGYEMDEFFVNDYLNLVVNPLELNRFNSEEEGVIEVSFDLIEEFMSGTQYLSLEGIRIYFGAVEPLIPTYEDYKGSEREVGKLELNQENLNQLNGLDDEAIKERLKQAFIRY